MLKRRLELGVLSAMYKKSRLVLHNILVGGNDPINWRKIDKSAF